MTHIAGSPPSTDHIPLHTLHQYAIRDAGSNLLCPAHTTVYCMCCTTCTLHILYCMCYTTCIALHVLHFTHILHVMYYMSACTALHVLHCPPGLCPGLPHPQQPARLGPGQPGAAGPERVVGCRAAPDHARGAGSRVRHRAGARGRRCALSCR